MGRSRETTKTLLVVAVWPVAFTVKTPGSNSAH